MNFCLKFLHHMCSLITQGHCLRSENQRQRRIYETPSAYMKKTRPRHWNNWENRRSRLLCSRPHSVRYLPSMCQAQNEQHTACKYETVMAQRAIGKDRWPRHACRPGFHGIREINPRQQSTSSQAKFWVTFLGVNLFTYSINIIECLVYARYCVQVLPIQKKTRT